MSSSNCRSQYELKSTQDVRDNIDFYNCIYLNCILIVIPAFDIVKMCYCKRANIRGGFNFAMFAVDDFSAKFKPPRSFYNTSVYSYLLLHVHLNVRNPRN